MLFLALTGELVLAEVPYLALIFLKWKVRRLAASGGSGAALLSAVVPRAITVRSVCKGLVNVRKVTRECVIVRGGTSTYKREV